MKRSVLPRAKNPAAAGKRRSRARFLCGVGGAVLYSARPLNAGAKASIHGKPSEKGVALDTEAVIKQKKSATVSLDELERLCGLPDYNDFVMKINGFIESGLLRRMGKDTNGKYPPLHSRYRICREEPDMSGVKDEIMRLGSDFNPSGYLSDIPLYIKHRELLASLRGYAREKRAELELSMSRNERAYAVWGNEKQLDDPVCKRMLRFTGWESRLNCYATPEPFLDYLCGGANTKSVLILENKDIWFSLRKLFMEKKAPCLVYGVMFDGILYGEGKKITRPGALEEYSREGFSASPSFWYWGDLDYEGIGIYLAISAFPVKLFTPGYAAMLERAGSRTLTHMRTAQAQPRQFESFLGYFDGETARAIRSILESGKYIPQEICNYPCLRNALDAPL
jgi:hypothetical protein